MDRNGWDCWQCQTTVTPILNQSGFLVLFLTQGVRCGVGRVGGSVVLTAVTTRLDSSRIQRAVTGLSDTVLLLGADRPSSERLRLS
jgi:hypothetical protein